MADNDTPDSDINAILDKRLNHPKIKNHPMFTELSDFLKLKDRQNILSPKYPDADTIRIYLENNSKVHVHDKSHSEITVEDVQTRFAEIAKNANTAVVEKLAIDIARSSNDAIHLEAIRQLAEQSTFVRASYYIHLMIQPELPNRIKDLYDRSYLEWEMARDTISNIDNEPKKFKVDDHFIDRRKSSSTPFFELLSKTIPHNNNEIKIKDELIPIQVNLENIVDVRINIEKEELEKTKQSALDVANTTDPEVHRIMIDLLQKQSIRNQAFYYATLMTQPNISEQVQKQYNQAYPEWKNTLDLVKRLQDPKAENDNTTVFYFVLVITQSEPIHVNVNDNVISREGFPNPNA